MNTNLIKKRRRCLLKVMGLVPYQVAWEQQRSLLSQRIDDPTLDDILLLLEHTPVYTLGTGANLKFLKFDPNNTHHEVYRIERGGEVTYHCPGQLIGYPILNLRYYQQDLHWYLRQLEEVIILLLGEYGLTGIRIPGLTGVWVDGYKVAAIGIKASRWVTMHGFSINVCPNIEGFKEIIPCGIEGKPVGSLAQFLPEITVKQVQQNIQGVFSEVFGVEMVPVFDSI